MTVKRPTPNIRLINNRYELIEKLGSGGMGHVYRAIDRLNNETIALKQVKVARSKTTNDSFGDSTMVNRLALTTEFQALASLHHPHIVSVLDYGWDENDTPYFTMAYLENTQNLLDASRDAPLDTRLTYLVKLLQALVYFHRRGIVHRDLKPDNILVTAEGVIKVVDFGIATAENEAQRGLLGTMLYMPPEAILNGLGDLPVTRKIDLYAVGLIAYEMFTGVYPYDRTNTQTLLQDILHTLPDLSLIPDIKTGNKAIETRLPLQTVIGRLVGKKPEFRYEDAADVIEDLSHVADIEAIGESTDVRESFLQAATFVGREAELALLTAHLTQLIDGQGSTFLIGGESGAGKSRLMEEVRIRALVQGVTVLRGQAVSNGGLPYELWRNVTRRLVLSTTISDQQAGVLSEIIPDISDLLQRDIPPVPTLEGESSRKRLINTILGLFAMQKQPILLLLEDIHWTIESLDVLQQLNPCNDQLQLMTIASFRDDEMPELPQILPTMELVKLNRLSPGEIAELSESMLGKSGKQPEVVALLQRETEGNVFFVVEVVRALAENAGQLDNVGKLTLPDSVFAGGIQMVIQRRLDQVEQSAHDILKLAAVYGRYLDLDIMFQLAEQTRHSLEDWLNACANATVLEQVDGQWRFTHDKLRDHILTRLSGEETRQLSRQVAKVVENIHGNDLQWVEVSMNLWQKAGNNEKAFDFMRILVDRLVKHIGDLDRAREYSEYALSMLDQDSIRRVDFLNPMSQINWRRGDYQQARSYASEAIALARSYDYDRGLAAGYNNHGNIAFYLGDYASAIDYYQRSADLYHALNDHWNWGLNLQNVGWTYPFIGAYDKAWEFTEQGISIFVKMDEIWGIANGYYIMALIATHQEEFNDAVAFHRHSLKLFDEFDEPWNLALNYSNLGFVYLELGEIDKAQKTFYDCLRVCHQAGLMGGLLEALVGIARLFVHHGGEKRAAALLGLIQAHPALNSDVQIRLKPLKASLNVSLSEADLQTAIENGAKMSLDDVIQKMLVESV